MINSTNFERLLSMEERAVIRSLKKPSKIQAFLDGIPYSTEDFYRCPLRVLRERRAHCFDGAVFGAAALSRIGHPPLIVDMYSNGRDDEHLLAVYKFEGHWGAVAKSNFVGLRYRDPVYRSLRELVMSYFDQYYNTQREKTLRAYTRPLNLKAFDRLNWMTNDETMQLIAESTDQIQRFALMTKKMAAILSPVDERTYRAGLLGSDPEGLFKIRQLE